MFFEKLGNQIKSIWYHEFLITLYFFLENISQVQANPLGILIQDERLPLDLLELL